MKSYLFLVICLVASICFCQEKTYNEKELSITKWIDGTLLSPIDNEKSTLAILIAGSGPTNRNGNQNFLKNNSLKKLAEGLTNNGIATFRYDKRIVKQIQHGKVDKDMMFDDFVSDASAVIDFLKEKYTYSKIYVIGHSQGSLVGMLAAKGKANGFISLAGAGQNIGDVLVEQVTKMAPKLGEEAQKVVDKLKEGKTIYLFYPQVSKSEARLLKEANEKAILTIIENMNHVLFEIKGDDLENSKSYNESFRSISPQLIISITEFIKS